jgi:hypothetical protein
MILIAARRAATRAIATHSGGCACIVLKSTGLRGYLMGCARAIDSSASAVDPEHGHRPLLAVDVDHDIVKARHEQIVRWIPIDLASPCSANRMTARSTIVAVCSGSL